MIVVVRGGGGGGVGGSGDGASITMHFPELNFIQTYTSFIN